jgi:hypothetical protein
MNADLAGPGPKPGGPTHPPAGPANPPPPSGPKVVMTWPDNPGPGGGEPPPMPPPPPPVADDALFAAVDEVLADWSFDLPRRRPWASFDLKGPS